MTSTTEPTAVEPDNSTEPQPATAEPSIRANRALHAIYTGGFTAFLGLAMAEVVYPLLVLGFTGKPLLAGLFGTIQFTALLLASVPVGNFADRHDRRRILVVSESIRAALATILAVTLAAGHVWLVEIYLIAAVLGVCQPLSSVRTLALRSVTPPSQLTKALSIQQVLSSVAELAGPAIGTALYTVNRSLPFVALAAGMAVSALCAAVIRFDSRPRPTAAAPDADALDTANESESPFAGIRIIWRNPVMRGTMLFIMLINLIGVPLELVLIVQAEHEGVPTHFIGLILAAFAVGSILGAPCIPTLHKLFRPGQLLVLFGVLISLALLMTGLFKFGGLWMAGWLAAIGFALPAAQVLLDVLILRQVPDHHRGRVLTAMMTFMGLGMPIGAAFGGSVLQIASSSTVLYGAAAAMAAIALFAASQRALRTAQWPSAD
jgi:MFS family permease